MIVYIDEYGNETNETEAKFKIVLSGSFVFTICGYKYEIQSIMPEIPLKYIYFDKPKHIEAKKNIL